MDLPRFLIFFNFTRTNGPDLKNILYSCYDFENEEIQQLIKKYDLKTVKRNNEDNADIYIFGLNEDSNANVFFKEEGQELDLNKFVTIVNCMHAIYPDFKDDIHLVLLKIFLFLFKNKNFGILDDIWSKLQYLLNDLNDNFLYALYLYQFYFSKFVKLNFEYNDNINKSMPLFKTKPKKSEKDESTGNKKVSKSTSRLALKDNAANMILTIEENVKEKLNDFASKMELPKLSFPEIYTNPRFQIYLPKIYDVFYQIYSSVLDYNGAILDQFYVLSWVFFPSIFNNYYDLNSKVIKYENKEKDNNDYINIKSIIAKRIYNDLRNIEKDLDTMKNLFGDFIQIELLDGIMQVGELDNYAVQKDKDNKNMNFLIPIPNSEAQIETFDQNFNNFPNMAYIIPSKYVTECAMCKHDLISIFDNDISIDEEILKLYSTSVVDDINPFILHSKLFQYISAFLLSDEQYSFQGNLLILAAKYTFDFFNTDSLEYPILNGLYGIIKSYINSFKKSDPEIPDFLTQKFFVQLANELIDDGRKILGMQTSNDDCLTFRIRNSVAIAYKFSAKQYLKDNINEFPQELNGPFEVLLNEIGADQINNDDQINYLDEIIELFDLKGFYYHFFILKLIYEMKMKDSNNRFKPMLQTVYKILNCLDECYVQILANYIYDENTFKDAINKFKKDFK